MSVLAFVPARGGSKGIKDKNIYNIAGKPLIYWVLNSLNSAKSIDKIVVATDSEKIKNVVNKLNFPKVEVYDRSIENASDFSPTIDVVLEYLCSQDVSKYNLFLLAQTTSPLVSCDDVEGFISHYYQSGVQSSLSCVEFPRMCWTPQGEPILHEVSRRKRRQDMNEFVLVENGALYINKIENILNEKSLLSGKISPYVMPHDTITEIDEYDDIKVVEKLLKRKYHPKSSEFKMFLTDCDGVMTDGGMYYSEKGEALKKFNTIDGMGIAKLKKKGLYVAVITGESTEFAIKRAQKLGIDCYYGITDKMKCVSELAEKYGVKLSEIAYVGDDINDLDVIKNVGFSACPDNALEQVKNNVNYIAKKTGGNGALREIIDFFLNDEVCDEK